MYRIKEGQLDKLKELGYTEVYDARFTYMKSGKINSYATKEWLYTFDPREVDLLIKEGVIERG